MDTQPSFKRVTFTRAHRSTIDGMAFGTSGIEVEYRENEVRIYPVAANKLRNQDTYISIPNNQAVLDVLSHFLQTR